MGASILCVAAVCGVTRPARAGPHYPAPFVADSDLDRLQKRLKAPGAPVVDNCRQANTDGCRQTSLARVRQKLKGLPKVGSTVRILHLGDSHVAADFITSRIRRDLQKKFGDAGRGFVHADQRWGYGGRLTKKSKTGWKRLRVVDGGRRIGRPYGFSGNSLTASRRRASLWYRVRPADRTVRLFLGAKRRGAVTVWLDKKKLGRFAPKGTSPIIEIPLPDRKPRKYRRGPPGNSLRIRAEKKGLSLYGLSFERPGPGVQYSSIGPVGADAKVYLQVQKKSFVRHLAAYRPDLVVYMVGGNDALKIRKRWTTLAKVQKDHQRLLRLVRSAVPEADCVLWAPMLAGRKTKRGVTGKRYLSEVRAMQRRVAQEEGCAFWDTMAAMGEPENVSRWVPVLAKDLVHPRKSAADLIGRMFVRGWSQLE